LVAVEGIRLREPTPKNINMAHKKVQEAVVVEIGPSTGLVMAVIVDKLPLGHRRESAVAFVVI
jgi:hypothetical protein